MTRGPAVVIGEHGEPDPAVTIDRLEAEGFEVNQDDSGYRVEGAVGGENNARVLPDAKALYWWWLGGRFPKARARQASVVVTSAAHFRIRSAGDDQPPPGRGLCGESAGCRRLPGGGHHGR